MESQYTRRAFLGRQTITALTATPQSYTVDISGFNRVKINAFHTYVAGTAVIHTFDVAETETPVAGDWVRVTSTDTAAGTGTRVRYTDSYATGSASTNFELRLADLDAKKLRVNVSATAGSTDSIIEDVFGSFAP